MPAFQHYARLAKIAFGVATGGAISAVVVQKATGDESNNLMPTVLASWTTNFHPSVAWDKNWDR